MSASAARRFDPPPVAAIRPRVLVLSGEEAVRDVLAHWLEEAGFEVFATGDGGAGARFLEEGTAQAVVTDRVFPHWQGLGSISAIKQRHPATRVVVAGCPPQDPWLAMARAVGADAVLPRLRRGDVIPAMS